MGRFKEIWNGEHKCFVRYAVYAGLVFLIFLGFIRQNNLIRWIRAGIQLQEQNRQIEVYRREIEEMDKKIKTLSTDRDSLEKFAREQFHFSRPGDDVYIIEE